MGTITTALRRPRSYAGQAAEVLNAARCVALYPLGMAEALLRAGPRSGDPARDVPVLLIHGFGHNRSGWFALDRSLRQAGFTSVHTMNYLPVAGVPALAAKLAERVDTVRRVTGAPRVHVVGHSLGGVLLRWFVQELGGEHVVDTAVTVASPHEGTVLARMAPGATARDLRPGSAVQGRLARRARATQVRWVAFYSNLDALVQPASSAMLRHPDLAATNVLVKDHGHLSMMVSPVVARAVVDQLLAGRSATAGVADLVPLRRRPGRHTATNSTVTTAAAGGSSASG